MRAVIVNRRRTLCAGLIAAAVPAAVFALSVQPTATGAADPCAASEVARTVSSVTKSLGDYLDAHPDTNNAMTSVLQQQAGPQSFDTLKTYFTANPKAATDLQSITQPLTGLSTRCKLPISLPQVMGLMQQAQGGGGLPNLPGGQPGSTPGTLPVGGPHGTSPASPAGPSQPKRVG